MQGKISSAQKYTIKYKRPYKLLKKSFNHLQNMSILAIIIRIKPIIRIVDADNSE